ncbi:TonB-dependent siderophore receptor [Rhodospirillum rubrum]|nr:TonB-dependent siderophore receptor [Rhodospirillum rubrum]
MGQTMQGIIRGVLMAGTALVALPVLGGPVQAADQPAGRQGAEVSEGVAFKIAAQSLDGAVVAFGRQSGWQVSVDPPILAGKSTPGVSGRMTPEAALAQLLSGTGVTWRRTDAKTVVLSKAEVDGVVTLDPLRVEGRAESAYGPVGGYVAKRSATATKTDTAILDTPQSITVVGAEEMETRNVQTLEDAIKYTPGVALSYGATGDTRSSWYQMRGFPVTTTFYRDGMKVSGQSWQKIDSYLLERVEILRGPASVLYGQNEPGGLVNAVSKRPQDTQQGEATIEYGSFDWKRAEGDITGPLDDEGHWLYRFSAALQDSDGLNGIDHDRNDRKVFAPSLTWTPRDETFVTLSAVYQEDDSRGWWPRQSYRSAAGTVDPSTYLGEPDYDSYHQEQNHLTLQAEHAVDESLKVNLSARYSKVNLTYHQTWPGAIEEGGTTIDRGNYAYKQDASVYTVDAHVQKKLSLFSTHHTLLGGIDYLNQDRDELFGMASDNGISLINPVYGTYNVAKADSFSKGDVRSAGLYAQDQIEIGEHWVFQLGGRQDLAGWAGASDYESTFTGRLGVAYKTDFGLVPYASYAESFEPQSGSGWGGARFEPTTGRQYEVGVKYEPPGTNIMATVAVFDLVKQNVLTTDPDPTHLCEGSRCSVQTGEVTSQGVEVGLTMGLAAGLNAVAAYTYNPIEVTKSTIAGEVGRQQAATPIHTASLWADYTVQNGPLAGLGLGGGLRFIGKTTSSADDLSTGPQIIDEAMVRYAVKDWKMSMNVKNILDRDIEYSCNNQAHGRVCYLNEPLTITARLTRSF